MGALDPEVVEQADRIVGKLRDRVSVRRTFGPASAAVVERNRPVVGGKGGDLGRPRRNGVAKAHQHE